MKGRPHVLLLSRGIPNVVSETASDTLIFFSFFLFCNMIPYRGKKKKEGLFRVSNIKEDVFVMFVAEKWY